MTFALRTPLNSTMNMMEKLFNGDTSADVAKLCDMEMRNRSADRPKHGAASRHLSKWSFNPTNIGRNSVKRRMLFGIANAHTRKIRKSKPYAVLHEMYRTGDLGLIIIQLINKRRGVLFASNQIVKEGIRDMFSARVKS